ncbi:MAG: hypothetical protein ABII12_01365 [Planctomycetota bacterium]
MRRRLRNVWALTLLAGVVFAGMDCPGAFQGPFADGPAARLVILRIVNASGLHARVNATFFAAESPVRETVRNLSAEGVESTELVVPTLTDLIHVVAIESGDSHAARVGDVLAERNIELGPEVAPGTVITFIIHPSGFLDCNENDVEDAVDIADGTSEDCNTNQIPDECESPTPVVVVVAEYTEIKQTDESGAAPTLLVDLTASSLGTTGEIAIDAAGGRIYFTADGPSTNDDSIQRIPLAGGSPTELVPTLDQLGGIGLDLANGRMFWSAFQSGTVIVRANLDGSNPLTVVTGLGGNITRVCVDPLNASVYFSHNPSTSPDFIRRADFDGNNLTPIISNATDPRDVDVWPQRDLMVWAEFGAAGGVFTADLDGNGAMPVAADTTVTGVAVDRDNCKLYWSVQGTIGMDDGRIERADLDGGNPEVVLLNLDAPQDVGVYPAPSAS